MSRRLPAISGRQLVRALRRAGFVVLRQKGSHVSLEKRTADAHWRTIVPRCENGEELTRKAGKPQSWNALLAAARAVERGALCPEIVADPDFALMFALSYPHRADQALVRLLDSQFG